MPKILLGNAPVSWGVYEAEPRSGHNLSYQQVLDEISQAGYMGTELGPYGYYPTNPARLAQELKSRHLRLASSYVAFPLDKPDLVQQRIPYLEGVCRLLAHFQVPYVMIAADATPERQSIAGRVSPDGTDSWSDKEWERVAVSMTYIGEAVERFPGMRIAFHHEASSPVETPAEIERLLFITDPQMVGLCFDSGHIVYGGGDAAELVTRFAERIWYVHLKDVSPEVLDRVRHEEIDAAKAWALGIFAQLGAGCVNIPRVVEELLACGYAGWMIVEQDIVADLYEPNMPLRNAVASRNYLSRELNLYNL